MIGRIKHFISGRSREKQQVNLELIIDQMKHLRTKSELLVFTFQPTGSSYLGVFNATHNLFPDLVVTLPAYHSNCLLSPVQFDALTTAAVSLQFEQVIFGTMPPSLLRFAEKLSQFFQVKMIFHGALSELQNKAALAHFGDIVSKHRSGIFSSVGFVKSGMEVWYEKCFGETAHRLELFPKSMDPLPAKSDGFFHVGVFVNDSFNKNKVTQVAAALSLPNTRVHTLTSEQDFTFLNDHRIITHAPLPHSEFIQLLGSMDVNMHITFSEGMGGQTFTESLQMGVPCLTSNTHQYLRFSDDLQRQLIVDEHDNPIRIAEYLEKISIIPRKEWKKVFDQYNQLISDDAEKLLTAFVDN